MSATMKAKSKRVKAKASAGKGKVETGSGDGSMKKSKATKAATRKHPKRVRALDAAAQVLAKAGKPMRAQELITAMAEQGLWKSPGGATPHSTLYAAMNACSECEAVLALRKAARPPRGFSLHVIAPFGGCC